MDCNKCLKKISNGGFCGGQPGGCGHYSDTPDAPCATPTPALRSAVEPDKLVLANAVERLQKITADDFHGYRSEVWNVLMDVWRRASLAAAPAPDESPEELVAKFYNQDWHTDRTMFERRTGHQTLIAFVKWLHSK